MARILMTVITALTLGFGSPAAQAAIAVLSGTGTVHFNIPFTTPGGAQYPYPGVAAGDPASFEVSYDPADPADGPGLHTPGDPVHGLRYSPFLHARVTAISVSTGLTHVFEFNTIGLNYWEVYNDIPNDPLPPPDQLNAALYSDGSGAPEANVSFFSFGFLDQTGMALSSTALPSSPIDLGAFLPENRYFSFGLGASGTVDGGFFATVDTLSWTPEPSSLTLLAFACLGLTGRSRFRSARAGRARSR